MLLENKYSKWYFDIINNAKNRELEEYYEKHHILPKSLGGTNSIDNIVNLTAREHWICHKLLTKFTIKEFKMKMHCAFWRMCNPQGNKEYHKIPSHSYAAARENFSEYRKKYFRHTEESKKKISKSTKGKLNGMYGRDRSNDNIYGKHNPSFIGMIYTPWGIYESSSLAVTNAPIKLSWLTILNYCRNNSKIISKRSPLYDATIAGLTMKELGFDFVPKEVI